MDFSISKNGFWMGKDILCNILGDGLTVVETKEGLETLGKVIREREEDGFEGEPGDEGEAGLGEELPKSEPAEEGGSLEDDAIEEMGEEGRAEGAEPELTERARAGGGGGLLGRGAAGGGAADFGKEEVVETLAAPEAEDAGEEDAASHAGDGDEGGVVSAGIAGEGGDNPEEDAGQETKPETAGCNGVGGATAVDFNEKVAEDVGNREHHDTAVDGDAEEIPEFDGGEVSHDHHAAHSSAHNHEVAGGFGGDFGVFGGVFHRHISIISVL